MLKLKTSSQDLEIIVQGARLTARSLSASELTRLRVRHTRVKKGAEQINGAELTKDMFDQVIRAWDEQIADEQGNPLDCTSANKRLVCEYNPGFVAEVLEEIERTEDARRSGELGNLPAGPSGASDQDE